MMQGQDVSAGLPAIAKRCRQALRVGALTRYFIGALAAGLLASAAAQAASPPAATEHAMQPLQDDELSRVRGADGIAFNLNNFSLTSSLTNPLTLTYLSPGGSSLALSGLDLSRGDDADPFADPYLLSLRQRTNLPDEIALDFPLNAAGNQSWQLTADFANCDAVTAGVCTGNKFLGGTLQILGLTMKGGGLYVSPSTIADTQGIAFGLGTQLDIASLAVYSRGRDGAGVIDKSDALTISGIHLTDANTGGAWMLADLNKHPGLLNAQTDASGSYLHLQVGWPTTSDPIPAAALRIDNITFTTAGLGGAAATVTNLGSASVGSLQINYLDIKLRTGQ
ncbi:MAG: hypothetical protein ACJ8GJ_24855 [Vitreoscilla sp.]